jgi:hypothetical protein
MDDELWVKRITSNNFKEKEKKVEQNPFVLNHIIPSLPLADYRRKQREQL